MKKNLIRKVLLSVMLIGVLVFAAACGSKTIDYSKMDFDKFVKLGEYKGLSYDLAEAEVTDEEIEASLKSKLDAASETTLVKEGTVADGDTINVSYEGKIDGKTFEGGSTESSDIIIGETSMIEGFVEGLIGKNIGDEVTLNLKFPDGYHSKKVAGKDVVFKVVIKGKKIKSTPELTDEWVSKNSKEKTVSEFKAAIEKELLYAKTEQNMQAAKNAIWQAAFDKSKVKEYPKEALAYEKEAVTVKYKETAENNYKISLDEYIKKYMNTTKKKFDKTAEEYAKSIVAQKLILNAIASKEKIEVTDDEYAKHLKSVLKKSGFTDESFKKNYKMSIEEYAEKMDWRTSMLYDKITNKLIEYGSKK